MIKELKVTCVLCIALVFIGCASITSIGSNLNAERNESEIILNIGNSIYHGRYNIYIDGEFRNTVKRKGGSAKFIISNGQHVVAVEWRGTPGTVAEEDSIQFVADSDRNIFYVIKPNVGNIALKSEGSAALGLVQ
jgi:hypothetical protein